MRLEALLRRCTVEGELEKEVHSLIKERLVQQVVIVKMLHKVIDQQTDKV